MRKCKKFVRGLGISIFKCWIRTLAVIVQKFFSYSKGVVCVFLVKNLKMIFLLYVVLSLLWLM